MPGPTAALSISYILADDLHTYRPLFLRHCGQAEMYNRRTVLSVSGQAEAPLYFLLSGMVKIYTTNPGGYVRILGYHQQDTLFAMDRICQEEAAVVTCEAVTGIEVLRVQWSDLTRMSAADGTLMPALLRYYGKVLRLMCYDAEIKSIDSVTTRLASFLCLTASAAPAGSPAAVRLTQEELASAVNASRVQIARICSEFHRQGLISSHRGSMTILDLDGLQHLAQGPVE